MVLHGEPQGCFGAIFDITEKTRVTQGALDNLKFQLLFQPLPSADPFSGRERTFSAHHSHSFMVISRIIMPMTAMGGNN